MSKMSQLSSPALEGRAGGGGDRRVCARQLFVLRSKIIIYIYFERARRKTRELQKDTVFGEGSRGAAPRQAEGDTSGIEGAAAERRRHWKQTPQKWGVKTSAENRSEKSILREPSKFLQR